MSKFIQAIRGMHDILPDQTPRWQYLEECVRDVVHAYGYREIRMPILEKTELFKRSIGEVTDIVEKEMYTFEDRNGDSLTLRPEGTAGGVRAGIEHGLIYNQTQRIWYMGPMFRHERPQKGRYRQFHQVGVEAFGFATPDIEAELLFMGARMWEQLGLDDIELELNTLGSHEERVAYRQHLVQYLLEHEAQLDEDSKRRLHSNPLRILDSKNPSMQALIESAPRLFDHLGSESRDHYEYIKGLLDAAGIAYRENPRLVRGLDYYCHTVFEWVTTRLGAQGTVCAGGRYDALVDQLGGKPTPAAGFALGVERLIALLEEAQVAIPQRAPHLFMAMMGDEAQRHGLVLAEQLRSAHPWLRLQANCGGGGFKAQFKRADRSGAELALILGDEEMNQNTVSVKPLRDNGEQITVPQAELGQYLDGLYAESKLEE